MAGNFYKRNKDKLSAFIRLICYKELAFLAGNWLLVASFTLGTRGGTVDELSIGNPLVGTAASVNGCRELYVDSRFLIGSLLLGIDAAIAKSVSDILLELHGHRGIAADLHSNSNSNSKKHVLITNTHTQLAVAALAPFAIAMTVTSFSTLYAPHTLSTLTHTLSTLGDELRNAVGTFIVPRAARGCRAHPHQKRQIRHPHMPLPHHSGKGVSIVL
jgi:hypothetical protein